MRYLLVSLGAVAGANARLLLGQVVTLAVPSAFPWATMLINVSGSVALGAFMALDPGRVDGTAGWRLLVAVGFCGSFTTFSTFSLEAWALLEQRAYAAAALYLLMSVAAGIGGFAAGLAAGSTLSRA